jgi:hypothetical protein
MRKSLRALYQGIKALWKANCLNKALLILCLLLAANLATAIWGLANGSAQDSDLIVAVCLALLLCANSALLIIKRKRDLILDDPRLVMKAVGREALESVKLETDNATKQKGENNAER